MQPTDNPSKSASVDGYLRKNHTWSEPLAALRELVLATGLTETIKWRAPCYTLDGANVVLLGAFKTNCVLSFPKGALLDDPKGLLEAPGPNTQSARVMRFADAKQVTKNKAAIVRFLKQAIANEQAGLSVAMPAKDAIEIPEALQTLMDANPDLKTAFEALTPGRQRSHVLHIGSAKQEKTQATRAEKAIPKIMAGKGQLDR